MCGRYHSTLPREAMRTIFKVDGLIPDLPARYNIAPTQPIPIIRRAVDGDRELAIVRWGLVPYWSPGPKEQKGDMINARAETVSTKPAFRDAFRRRRCIIPATGFYEWRPEGKGKQPYAINRRDGQPMAFAGLWERWKSQETNEVMESTTIIVTDANEALAPIHDRMPVILLDEAEIENWLDPATPPDALKDLLRPCPADVLVTYPVSRRVSSPANDDPQLIDPISL